MNNDDLIDDIVAMLDQSVTKGTGHLNVTVNTTKTNHITKEVDTSGCLDCAAGNLACNIPTLHEGMDDQTNE